MRLILTLAVALCVIGAGACASLNTLPPQLQPRTTVTVSADKFAGTTTVLGIEKTFPGDRFNRYLLRSWVQRDSTPTHQLYVSDYYDGDWKFFENANGEDARTLPFAEISHEVVACGAYSGCSLHEVFGAEIPDSLLRARADAGYAVKFYAKTGDTLVVRLAPEQIKGELAAVDSVRQAARIATH